jgi:hypothetical protein
MFRSISDQLYKTVDRHAEVRQRIVDYMVQHSDHFSLFIEDDEHFEEYIARMRTSREWGGHQELFAATCCLNISIFVYQLHTRRWVLPSPDDQDTLKAVSVYLSYHGEYHYNSLHAARGEHKEAEVLLRIPTNTNNCSSSSSSSSSSTGREAEVDHLLLTLPWLFSSSALASLEACEYHFDRAVEFAIEHFFAVTEDEVTAGSLPLLAGEGAGGCNGDKSVISVPVPVPVSTDTPVDTTHAAVKDDVTLTSEVLPLTSEIVSSSGSSGSSGKSISDSNSTTISKGKKSKLKAAKVPGISKKVSCFFDTLA